jgi:hypothetical protein
MTIVNAGTNALAYVGAYGRNATASGQGSAGGTAGSEVAATNVTLSGGALALLAAQGTAKDFSTVAEEARATLDTLYQKAGVTVPLAGGRPTIDLTTLDRRTLFAIASNSGSKFTADERKAAGQELQRRFDAALGPPAAAAQLVGDYSTLYKAALDYLDGMSTEEKATDAWARQRVAVVQGLDVAKAQPATAPQGIAGDPVADFLARSADGVPDDAASNPSVARAARLALDQQYDAAKKRGQEIVFDPQRRTGRLIDLSSLSTSALSAVATNEGRQFSADEARAASKELGARTRASMLQAVQKAGASGDPRAFSLAVIQQYYGMSAQERQAANWSSALLDKAVVTYKSTSAVMNMFALDNGQASLNPLAFGTNPLLQ